MNKDKIIQLEEKLRLAMLSSDVDVLDNLIADTLMFTLPTGDIANKRMDLEAHRSGIQKLTELNLLEQNIQVYENFAIVAAKMQLAGTYDSNSINGRYSYTRVWSKVNNNWQIVAGHVSQLV